MQDPEMPSGGTEEEGLEKVDRVRLEKAVLFAEERFVWALNEIRYFKPGGEGWRRLTFDEGRDKKNEMSFEVWESLMYRICQVWALSPRLPLVSEVISRLVMIAMAEIERFAVLNSQDPDRREYATSLTQLMTPGVPGRKMFSDLTAEDLFTIIGPKARAECCTRLAALGLEFPPFTTPV